MWGKQQGNSPYSLSQSFSFLWWWCLWVALVGALAGLVLPPAHCCVVLGVHLQAGVGEQHTGWSQPHVNALRISFWCEYRSSVVESNSSGRNVMRTTRGLTPWLTQLHCIVFVWRLADSRAEYATFCCCWRDTACDAFRLNVGQK